MTEDDILEKFISTEIDGKKVKKIKRAARGQAKKLELYAKENTTFIEITEYKKYFKKEDTEIDLAKLGHFIPAHKTNKR